MELTSQPGARLPKRKPAANSVTLLHLQSHHIQCVVMVDVHPTWLLDSIDDGFPRGLILRYGNRRGWLLQKTIHSDGAETRPRCGAVNCGQTSRPAHADDQRRRSHLAETDDAPLRVAVDLLQPGLDRSVHLWLK